MREVVFFGMVGALATGVHYLTAVWLVAFAGVGVLVANFLAYCVAVAVSYFGHTRLTFNATVNRSTFIRFLIVSLSALVLSQLVLLALQRADFLPYQLNLVFGVGVIPLYSFLCNKFWVYRQSTCHLQ